MYAVYVFVCFILLSLFLFLFSTPESGVRICVVWLLFSHLSSESFVLPDFDEELFVVHLVHGQRLDLSCLVTAVVVMVLFLLSSLLVTSSFSSICSQSSSAGSAEATGGGSGGATGTVAGGAWTGTSFMKYPVPYRYAQPVTRTRGSSW